MGRNDDMLKKLRAGNFVENNGKVMFAINLLRHKFIELKSVYRVRSDDISEQEFLDCINYLSQEGYITLRISGSREYVRLADADYKELEALVTSKGIQLLGGIIKDKMVDV